MTRAPWPPCPECHSAVRQRTDSTLNCTRCSWWWLPTDTVNQPIAEALHVATAAAWDDNQRRITYPSGERFADLPEQTRALWLGDTRAAVLAYLTERAAQRLRTHGADATWTVLLQEAARVADDKRRAILTPQERPANKESQRVSQPVTGGNSTN